MVIECLQGVLLSTGVSSIAVYTKLVTPMCLFKHLGTIHLCTSVKNFLSTLAGVHEELDHDYQAGMQLSLGLQ
jgi:hypothetical protein